MENQKSLILISPPGSIEASGMGYINVPKIGKEPPTELKEVQEFTDKTGFQPPGLEGFEEIKDDKGLSYSLLESNVWISKEYIESKGANLKLIITLFPEFLKYALPWVLCEYGYHCWKTKDLGNLKVFVENAVQRRAFDYLVTDLALKEKSWRKDNVEKPLHYLYITMKNIEMRQGPELPQIQGKMFLSINTPLIESDSLSTLTKEDQASLQNWEHQNRFTETEIFLDWKLTEKRTKEVEEMKRKVLNKACKQIGLSSDATKIFITNREENLNLAKAAEKHGLSHKYEPVRKEIYRKKKDIEKYLNDPLIKKLFEGRS